MGLASWTRGNLQEAPGRVPQGETVSPLPLNAVMTGPDTKVCVAVLWLRGAIDILGVAEDPGSAPPLTSRLVSWQVFPSQVGFLILEAKSVPSQDRYATGVETAANQSSRALKHDLLTHSNHPSWRWPHSTVTREKLGSDLQVAPKHPNNSATFYEKL